jgi:hypothetical protein
MSVCRACLTTRSQASLYLDLTCNKSIHQVSMLLFMVSNKRHIQKTCTTLTDISMTVEILSPRSHNSWSLLFMYLE